MLETSFVDNDNWDEINAVAKALAKVGYVSGIDNSVILAFFESQLELNKYWNIAFEQVLETSKKNDNNNIQ